MPMVMRKKRNDNSQQNMTQKLNITIEQYEPHQKNPGVMPDDQEELTVPVTLVVHIVLLLLQTK